MLYRYVKYEKNRPHGLEEKSFENVTGDGRRLSAYTIYKITYEPSAQVSLKLQKCFLSMINGE